MKIVLLLLLMTITNMSTFLHSINIPVNEHLRLKDPLTSELGMRILQGSISMINELGFEDFTFKKLAAQIETTEASVYRYFESKHKLLLYLINWYWGMIEYRLILATNNIDDPEKRLKRAIELLVSLPSPESSDVFSIEPDLKQIVIQEAPKVYLHKQVDNENKLGVFSAYKSVVARVVEMVKAVNPRYSFPNMLVSTIIEGSNQQRFFADHLPKLTNHTSKQDSVKTFFIELIFKTLKSND
jgi:AcrR family transcriptional regulator